MSDSGIDKLLAERQRSHGDFGAVAETAEALDRAMRWMADSNPSPFCYLDADRQLALRMLQVKIARIIHGDDANPEHWRDIAGYATLMLRELEG